MTTKEILHEMYSNAEIVWAEYHNLVCSRKVSVMYDGTEYRIFDEDKPILEEVQRRLEMSEWHTGTPTESGWYLVAYKKRDCDGSSYWEYGARLWIEIIEGEGHWDVCEEKHPVIAWQRIEPFEEANE